MSHPLRKHRIADTSLEAYASVKPKLSERQQRALSAITCAQHGLTREELSRVVGLPIQTICGIARALLDRRLITEDGKRATSSGCAASVLKVARPTDRGMLF